MSLVAGGSHFRGTLKHAAKDKTDLWLTSTYACIRDESGRTIKIGFTVESSIRLPSLAR